MNDDPLHKFPPMSCRSLKTGLRDEDYLDHSWYWRFLLGSSELFVLNKKPFSLSVCMHKISGPGFQLWVLGAFLTFSKQSAQFVEGRSCLNTVFQMRPSRGLVQREGYLCISAWSNNLNLKSSLLAIRATALHWPPVLKPAVTLM